MTATNIQEAVAEQPQQTRNALTALTEQLNLVNTGELYGIIRNTIMPNGATDEELAAFCMVAATYKLNPLVKEIHAFRTKQGGIMPMIGIDGWLKLLMSNEDYDGMEHVYSTQADGEVWVECRIYSKARPKHPTVAREFLSENEIKTSPVWQQRPRRMLKHRATIQAIRYFAGICGFIDMDEAREEEMSNEPRNVTPQAKGKTPLTLNRPARLKPAPGRPVEVKELQEQQPEEVVKQQTEQEEKPTAVAPATPEEEAALDWFNRSLQASGATFNKAYKALDAAGHFRPKDGAPRPVVARWCAELKADAEAREALEQSGIVFEK